MKLTSDFKLVLGMIAAVLPAACEPIDTATPTANAPIPTPTAAVTTPTVTTDDSSDQQLQTDATTAGYTHLQPDGNRILHGTGNLPRLDPLDIPLDGVPKWVTAVSLQNKSIWVAILADNHIQAFQVNGRHATPIPIFSFDGNAISTDPIEQIGDGPPLLQIINEAPDLLQPPASNQDGTHPILLAGGKLTFTTPEQAFIVGNQTVSDITPLPDGRILQDEHGRLLLLTNPTERYGHGVLGDPIEAAGISLIATGPAPALINTITIPEPRVIEGIAPIWVDWNGDGEREIVVTLSDSSQGAQIVLFDEQGNQLAAGPAIGRGSRWRHQLAVAPFGPNGEMELVDVLTPHIGGTVEFYQWRGDTLDIVAQVPGYTSHVIGSRNLDMALAGDLDGNGRFQLLLPNQRRTELGAIRRTANGAEVAWTLPIDGELVTNLMGITLEDGSLAVGLGREDGTLRVWTR